MLSAPARAALTLLASVVMATIWSGAATAAPNVVLIVTDDQSVETLPHMPNVQQLLVDKGVTFSNAFASNPFCCPARAALLSGRYSHTTGVYDNEWPNGGYRVFPDTSTLPVWLQTAGYRTALMGKYMNDYHWTYRPPGWSEWYGLWRGGYYGVSVSVNGELTIVEDSTYAEHWYRARARDFITSTPAGQPLFLYYATRAPHLPTEPEERYRGAFAHLAPFRPASFNEADTSDKPAWVRAMLPLSGGDIVGIDQLRRSHLETLLSVDDSVAEIVAALRDTGRLADTLIIFTSDNGWGYGQHRVAGKRHAYDESIRVPLVVRYDPLTGGGARTEPALLGNVDVAPTIAGLAGVGAPAVDGVSAIGLLTRTVSATRGSLLIEHSDPDQLEPVPTYCGIRSLQWHYVQYATREEELYDVIVDPDQLLNRAGDPALGGTLEVLRSQARTECSPQPPGWTGEPVLGGAFVQPVTVANPLTATWGTDHPERGVTAYDVQVRSTPVARRRAQSDEGWMDWLVATPLTSATLKAAPGSTTCVRARSRDSLGNASPWTEPGCTSRPSGEASLRRKKGAWRRVRGSAYLAGSVAVARARGATLSTSVRATQLHLVATTCPKCGRLDVWFRGRRVRSINLRSARLRRGQLLPIATFPAPKRGTLLLRASSKSAPIFVEGVAAVP